jgi:hypothetical protein
MIQRYVPILTILLILAATSLFNVKYAVVAAESEISRTLQEIEAERWRLRTLEADWAYLVRAERLASQARALGMAPATPERVVEAKQIGDYRLLQLARESRPAELPEGEQLLFRVKPVTAFALPSLGDRRDPLGQGW